MRKVLSVVKLSLLIVCYFVSITQVILDNKALTFDVPPTIENDRTHVPLWEIFEALGADVQWNDSTQTVTASLLKMNFSFKAQDTLTSFGAQCLLALDSAILTLKTSDLKYMARAFGRNIVYRVADGAFSTGKAFYYGSFKAYKIVRNNETVKYYVKNPRETPGAIKGTVSYFWKNPGKLVMAGVSFKAASLGFLAGYFTPDLDIAILGIGGYRNWAFHSAIPVWLIKKIPCLLNKVDSYDNSKRSKAVAALQKYVGAPLVAGYSFGVGTHLVIDSLSIKDVVGFPVEYLLSGGNVLDRVWLFGNGLICFSIGKELILFAMGKEDDIEKIKLLAEKAGNSR